MKYLVAATLTISLSFSICVLGENTIYKCGNTYSSTPCENGSPLGRLEINRYKQPESYKIPPTKNNPSSVHKNKSKLSSKNTEAITQELNANSNGAPALTITGSDVDRMLLQLGVKACDQKLKKERPELCK